VLPAGNRLRRRQEFATAIRRGRQAGRPLLVLHLHHDPDSNVDADADAVREAGSEMVAPAPRVGLVVGRTVGPAVVRNRVRRQLRHLLRDRVDRLPPGALLVVRALPGAAGAASSALAADLDRALRRVLQLPGVVPESTREGVS